MNSFFAKWAKSLGIEVPAAEDLNMLSHFLRDNFGDLNATDFNELIRLISTDSLDFADKDKHFGKLSPIYVSKAVKAYKSKRSDVVFKVRDQIEKEKKKEAFVPNDSERVSGFRQILKNAKDEVSKGETYHDTGDVLYYFFWNNHLVTRPMPDDLINRALQYGESIYRQRQQGNALKKIINDVSFTKDKKVDIIHRYARIFAVNEWIKSLDIDKISKELTIEMIKK